MLINTGTIPVIVLSSRTPIGNRDAARKAGAVAYIHKPFDVPVLVKAINDASASPQPMRLPSPASTTPVLIPRAAPLTLHFLH